MHNFLPLLVCALCLQIQQVSDSLISRRHEGSFEHDLWEFVCENIAVDAELNSILCFVV